jgi:hypothetical protein
MNVQAKSKVKMRRERAIREFKEWKRAHPKATSQECYDAFDRFIDSIELERIVNRAA